MKKVTRKHITEAEFDRIKQLQGLNLSNALLSKITGRSPQTLKFFTEATDFKHYTATPKKTIKVAPKQERPEEDTNLILLKLDQISVCLNTLLDIIQDKEAKANASFWKR